MSSAATLDELTWPGRHPVRHILAGQPGADKLVVVFSAFNGTPNQPRYHYIKRLVGLDAHRLHILDDIGQHGCYYLGTGGDPYLADTIHEMTTEYAGRLGVEEIWCIGSSKG